MNRVVSRNLKALTSFLRLALIAVLMLSLLPALPVAAANAAVPASVEQRTELDASAAAPLPAFGAAGAQISRAAARGASVLSLPVAAPARAPDAPVITATKTDALFNDLPPAGPTAGDTIRYTVTIVNSGDMDALNAALADTIDSRTTLVGGSLRTTPIARNDGVYQVLGNVGISVPDGASDVLANDNDPDGGSVTVVAFDATSANGGSVSVNANGSFSYNPAPGYVGADSFSYTIQDSDGNQDSATVTLNVSNMIWFINNTAGAGDGRLSSPFNSLAAFNAAQGATQPNAKPGDSIFIYSGSGAYASGIVLQNSQLLVGQGATATIQAITGITPPAFSNALPATGGSKPTIQNSGGDGIALAANNLVRGLTAGNASGSGIAGSNVGTLTVSEVIVNNATGGGIEVATGTLAVTLQSLTTTSSSDEGIDLTGVAGSFTVSAGSVSNTNSRAINIDGSPSLALNVTLTSVSSSNTTKGVQLQDTTGSFTVTGTGVTDGTGGTIQTITQRGFEAISAQNIALSNMNFTNATTANGVAPGTATCNIAEPSGFTNTGCNAPIYLETVTGVSLTNLTINGSAQNGINGNGVTNFSLVNSDLNNIGNENLENGVQFLNLLGTNTFNNVSIVGSFTRNALIENVQGTSTINLLNSTINTALGQDGFFVKGASRSGNNATITFNVTDSSFTQNQASQLKAHAEENSQVTVDITGNSFTGNAAVVGNSGIDLAARDSATLNFDVVGTGGNPQTFNNGRSHAVNVFISSGGTGVGTVSGNTINGSVVGAGVRAIAEVSDSGNPALTINISNNDINAIAGTGLAAIDVRSRQGVVAATGVANIQATISNNGVDVTNTADANIQFYINSGNTLCGNVTNNTATGVPFFTDSFYVGNPVSGDSNGPGIAQLQGWTGNIDTTWNNNGNTPVNSAFNEGTAPVAATCATVPPAPAHAPEGNQLSVISDQLSQGTVAKQQTTRAPASLFNLPIDQPAAPVSRPTAPTSAIVADQSTNLPIYQAPSDSRAPESGETVNVALGTLNPGQQVVITFDVIIDTPTTPQQIVSQVCNQGTVSATDLAPVLTDDPDVGGAANPTCTTLALGSITIAKDQTPDGNTVFGFTSTIPGNASFNVNGDSSLPISNVTPGSYTVTENDPAPLFSLTGLSCNDGASGVPSTGNTGTRTATINLEPGETITCTFTNTQQGVDLQVTKSDGGISAEPGDTVVYTLSYTNTGPIAASGVVLTETVPANTTFNAGASTAGWVCVPDGNAGSTCTLAVGAVASAGNGSATFAVDVDSPLAQVTQISNTVCIGDDGANGPDQNPNDNCGDDTTPLQAGSITIVKATNPAGGTGFNFSGDLGAFGLDDGGQQPFAGLPSGDYDVTEAVPAGWSLTGVQCVGGDSTPITDGVTVNLDPGENITCTFTNTEHVDLQVTKSDGGVTAEPGDTVAYTLSYANAGGPAAGVVLTETVPANTTFNAGASTAGWVCVPDGNAGSECTLAIGALAASGNGSATFAVDVDSPLPQVTQISNTVCIGDDGSNGPDQNPNDNCGDDTTPLQAGSITIAKVTNPSGGTGFNFSGDLGAFGLDDGGQQPFMGLPSGDYDITEAAAAGWLLAYVTCQGGGFTLIPGGITVHLDPGENITCTFTNQQLPLFLELSKSVNGPTSVTMPGGSGQVSYTVAYTSTAVVTGTAVFTDTPSIDVGSVLCSDLTPATLDPGASGSQVVDCAVTITPDMCVELTATLNNTVVADFSPLDGFGAGAPTVTITVPPSDPNNPLCNPQFSIVLTKTVGLDANVCAATDNINLPFGGDQVTYCYEVQNTGNIDLTFHDLVDSELGTILNAFPYTLSPGSTVFVTQTAFVGVTTVNTATWTAYNPVEGGGLPPGEAMASDTATVTVDLPDPVIVLTKTVGLDANVCAITDMITVPPGGVDVTYCYTVQNTGNIALTVHDLVDTELGTILNSFPYTLTPGASVFVTATANIVVTTVNTATWTASSVNPTSVASSTDSATVVVMPPTAVRLGELTAGSVVADWPLALPVALSVALAAGVALTWRRRRQRLVP